MKKLGLGFIVAILSTSAFAQLVITAEIRPRAEFRNGFKRLHAEHEAAAFFVEQRSRVYVDFSNEKLSLRFSVQDVRLWGENDQIFKSDNALFGVHEAWGQYAFNEKFSFKIGRQELDYDNARLLGNLSWAQQSRVHDALKLTYESDKLKWHIGAAFNQEDIISAQEPGRLEGTFYNGINNYKAMQYSWIHRSGGNGKWSLLFLNQGLQAIDSSVYFSQTFGGNAEKLIGGIRCGGEVYYQTGKDRAGKQLRAYLLAFSLRFNVAKVPFTIGMDHLSGTDPSSTKNTSFDPLYGTHHKFYGFMDYFYVGNTHASAGLSDIYINTNIKLSESSTLNAYVHEFFSDAVLISEQSEEMSKQLGTEIDLVYTVKIGADIAFNLGYSQLFASSTMELIKGGDKKELQYWAWTMLTIKPTLFEK